MLIIYWFIPYNLVDFEITPRNSNFSLGAITDMQFYSNMRFPNPEISYKISDDCTLQKKRDMEQGLEIIANRTLLDFYPVINNEEISINCESKNKIEEGLFIAGEGGPTNITKTNNFNVILHGQILLIRDSSCQSPNIAIHELLHVLGFDHSLNKQNIMYNISSCGQTIGEDMIYFINEIYKIPSYPDLLFENASAIMRGKYLDVNLSIRNNGLKNSEETEIEIYANDNLIKSIDFDSLEIGYGRAISLSNIWVSQLNSNNLKFIISSDFSELDKENNIAELKIKE